jgi:PQQ-like domain
MACDAAGHRFVSRVSRTLGRGRGAAFAIAVLLAPGIGCSRSEDDGTSVAREAITASAFVQASYSAPQSAPSSVTVTFGAAQGAGDLVVVVVGWHDATAQVSSVTDTAKDVFQRAIGPTARGTQVSQSIYYAANVAAWAAGNVVTVKFNGAAQKPDIRILEYRNVDAAHPVDVAIAGSGSSTTASSGSATTTRANDLLVAADTVYTHTSGPGSGFTSRILTSPDGDIAEDRVAATVGSYGATAPLSSTGAWVMQMVAFRAHDIQVPTAPANLAATAASTSRIGLAWTPSTDDVGVTGYLVERCAGAGCASFAQVGTSASSSFSDTGLAARTSYSYRVRATDAAGNVSAYSGTATATTLGDLGGACGAGNQCGSGFCVAGICCDTACTGNACMACDVPGSAGHCSARPNGTSCSDGNACTQTDSCQAGACVGGNAVVCAAQDQCHVAGACDPASGTCGNPAAADGTSCSDGSACTRTDSCQAGACVGGNPVVCTAQDQCHVAGACDPASGVCSNPGKVGGSTLCGTVCVDAVDDDLNCGGCDVVCPDGQSCSAGVCRAGLSRWPTLGGNVSHSGQNANEIGGPPVGQSWSCALTAITLWPAVADGTFIYVSEKSNFQHTTNLWALSPADGHVVWKHDFGKIFGIGQATAASGRVYVGQSNNAGSTFMYAFDAPTGTLLWSQPFTSQWEQYWAPLVVGTRLYFDGGRFGGLYGLSTLDGTQLFFNNQLEQYDQWSPLWFGGKVYTFIAGNLRAHDPLTGGIQTTTSVPWTWAGWSMQTAPISDGASVYVVAPPSL